ncbi:COG1470 family protein [Amycolatopsis kentuckyensis]|uniref:COG1470 family protein n=1 Tax=Amycolatopsis kentuckyensis TaxID=218823 RepID=UPI000A36C285|nr:NEW3 domain-containing protein [Amycolatopsis kentuckyensis]
MWIDGDRRTAPDGSSFAWQHWTHTFDLAIVAGEGDWRDAGFPRGAQEAAHPLRARPVPPTPGPLPPALSLIAVEPAEVVLTAAKPAGNPLASGAVIPPADAITLRVYESTGSPVTASVALHGGIRSAWRTDLLEERGEPVTVDDGRAHVELGAADVATLRLEPVIRWGTGREIATEPVQPVPTRYWLHNEGPAPVGNLPVSVHVTPTRLKLADGRARFDVTVSCSGRPGRGRVELELPPGWRTGPAPELDYDLQPGEHAKTAVEVQGPETPGRYLVAARISDDGGQILEDTAEILVGAPPPRDDLVDVGLPHGPITLGPGGSAELPVSLTNLAQSEIRGGITAISPFGTWAEAVTIGPRAQPFRLAAGASGTVPLTVHAGHTARPGAHWWVLVRVTAHGRLAYSPAVEVRIE